MSPLFHPVMAARHPLPPAGDGAAPFAIEIEKDDPMLTHTARLPLLAASLSLSLLACASGLSSVTAVRIGPSATVPTNAS